jgi:hypothetical protein
LGELIQGLLRQNIDDLANGIGNEEINQLKTTGRGNAKNRHPFVIAVKAE